MTYKEQAHLSKEVNRLMLINTNNNLSYLNSTGSGASVEYGHFRFKQPVSVRTLPAQLNQPDLSIGSPVEYFITLNKK